MEALHWHSMYFGMQLLCCVLYFGLDKYCKKLSCILVSSLAFNVRMILTDIMFSKEVLNEKKKEKKKSCNVSQIIKIFLVKKFIKICDRPTAFYFLIFKDIFV